MFSAIVGKTIAIHIRDRRLLSACNSLAAKNRSVLDIALENGYNSAQTFTRAFKGLYGISPKEYRKQGLQPVFVSVDELIMKFTNRLKGGIFVNPNLIKRDELWIAGIFGNGKETAAVWKTFSKLEK